MCKLGHVLLLAVAAIISLNGRACAEISALEMRHSCRGIEAATLHGDDVYMDTAKYPNAFICWGAFSTLHQASLYFYEPNRPTFLPDVCPMRDNHGQKAVVLVKVFTHYVDEHPQDAGKNFIEVAWESFKTAWPCPNY
jgi:hypothetical protein